jgi:ABC-type nitrate/sulfonate/bicarbonate transport system substrate-binding protein
MRWLLSGILMVSVLAACAPSGTAPAAPSKPPTAPTAPAAAAPAASAAPSAPAAAPAKPEPQPINLEIGLPATTAFTWPFLVIRDGPIGPQERVTLELTILDTDQRVTQATLSGSIDIGEASFDTVVRAVEQGGDVVTIGGNINRPPYALAVRQGIDSIADLRGKKFAVTDLRGGSRTCAAAARWCSSSSWKPTGCATATTSCCPSAAHPTATVRS